MLDFRIEIIQVDDYSFVDFMLWEFNTIFLVFMGRYYQSLSFSFLLGWRTSKGRRKWPIVSKTVLFSQRSWKAISVEARFCSLHSADWGFLRTFCVTWNTFLLRWDSGYLCRSVWNKEHCERRPGSAGGFPVPRHTELGQPPFLCMSGSPGKTWEAV